MSKQVEVPEVHFVGRDLSITLPDGGTAEVVGYIVRFADGSLDLMQREGEDLDPGAIYKHFSDRLLSDEAVKAALEAQGFFPRNDSLGPYGRKVRAGLAAALQAASTPE